MEKILTTLKIVLSVIIIIVIGIFIILFYESGKAEKDYQSAIQSMKEGNWQKALEYAQMVPYYKDSNDIYIYAYPNKIFYDKYSTDEEAINSYKKGIVFINSRMENLKGSLKDEYKKDLKDLLNIFQFKINELSAKGEYNNAENLLNDAIELIKKNDLKNAQDKLLSINNTFFTNEKQELLNYINLLNTINIEAKDKKVNDVILNSILKLNPDYNGKLSEEIKKTVQGYIDMNKWYMLYQKENIQNSNLNNNGNVLSASINNDIKIGSTRQEVINILGAPINDYIISSKKYGTYEKMTFSSGRIVYLENNIVTVIKG